MAEFESFTMGTKEMVDAMFRQVEDSGETYPLHLNPTDTQTVAYALATACGFVEWDDAPEGIRENAESLFGGMAETLGIEGV